MSKYNPETLIKFTVSIGYVGCRREETFTLGGLGYDPEYDGSSDENIEAFLSNAHEEWMYNNIDFSWGIEE